VKLYAIRAREFSDAVAALGPGAYVGPASRELLQEVRTRQGLCNEVADQVERYLNPKGAAADSSS
jgi:hypothetical protein